MTVPGESNQVKWAGMLPVRPEQALPVQPAAWDTVYLGNTRTQIIKSVSTTGGAAIVHTVTAGKTLYLCSVQLTSGWNISTVSWIGYRDAGDVSIFDFIRLQGNGVHSMSESVIFPMPLIIASAYDVYIASPLADITGCITGWEQ